MGQAKIKQRTAFSPQLIAAWEADDCINFAIALARLTGWLLHVDWWAPSSREDIPLDQLKPLRVYVADNHDLIFDVRGVRSIVDFTNKTVAPLARKFGNGGVRTRFYDEATLSSLPLRSQPDESKIAEATAAIKANTHYLATIPPRQPPYIPAHKAALFTYGRCGAFAEAMRELTGLQPTALLALRFSPQFEGTRRTSSGYFHSVVLHPDGEAEDSWGKAPLAEIAGRFGVIEFTTSDEEHQRVLSNLKTNSADAYAVAHKEAVDVIQRYRIQPHGVEST